MKLPIGKIVAAVGGGLTAAYFYEKHKEKSFALELEKRIGEMLEAGEITNDQADNILAGFYFSDLDYSDALWRAVDSVDEYIKICIGEDKQNE
jgi:transcription antitermination factor NusG